jgi:hypothetical protein
MGLLFVYSQAHIKDCDKKTHTGMTYDNGAKKRGVKIPITKKRKRK